MKPEILLPKPPQEYSTLYLDMDSFFASVEQYYHPELRNRPVAIVSGPSGGASVIAASRDAKRAGVGTGTKVERAQALCPNIACVFASPQHYRDVHRAFMTILHSTIGQVHSKGIDEAAVLIPSYARSREGVLALSKAIKSQVYDLYNEYVKCSIGVASNRWQAKMAASFDKPDGLLVLSQAEAVSMYSKIKLTDMTGIATRMARRLIAIGITTPTELYRCSYRYLRRNLGVVGGIWYLRLRGYELDGAQLPAQRSIGHQITTVPDMPDNLDKTTTFIMKIADTLGKRLRSKNLKYRSMNVSLLFEDHTWASTDLKRLPLRDDNASIIVNAKLLLKKLVINKPIKKITMTLADLIESNQLSLALPSEYESDMRLSRAIDMVREKFGDSSISYLERDLYQPISLDKIGFAGDITRETSVFGYSTLKK